VLRVRFPYGEARWDECFWERVTSGESKALQRTTRRTLFSDGFRFAGLAQGVPDIARPLL
jgi:hypothetical protein